MVVYEDGWMGHVMGNWNQKMKWLCLGFYSFDMMFYLQLYICVMHTEVLCYVFRAIKHKPGFQCFLMDVSRR